MNATSSPRDFRSSYVGPLIVALVYCVLAYSSFGRWGSYFGDFGHQLYVPWALAKGEVLYRDIFWLYGPLSQYFHAGLFMLFRPTAQVILISNLICIALLLALIYSFVLTVADRFTATFACVAVAVLNLFAEFLAEGTYSFAAPYAHEAAHGMLLLMALLALLVRLKDPYSLLRLGLVGFVAGLTLLTKPEIGLCALVALAVFFFLRREILGLPQFLVVLGTYLVPIVSSALIFAGELGPVAAIQASLGAFVPLIRGGESLYTDYFQQQLTGLDSPQINGALTLEGALVDLGLIGAGVVLDFICRTRRHGFQFGLVAALCIFGALFLKSDFIAWLVGARGLLIVVLMLSALRLRRLRQLGGERSSEFVGIALLAACAFACSARMILNQRLVHYGFYLSLPSVVLLVILLLSSVPQCLEVRYRGGTVFRSLAAAVLLAGICVHFRCSNLWFEQRTFPLSGPLGGLYLVAPSESDDTRLGSTILDELAKIRTVNDTLAVIPNGGMLNVALQLANPTRYAWLGFETQRVESRDQIVGSFKSGMPSYILFVDNGQHEFGLSAAEEREALGPEFSSWLNMKYEFVEHFGDDSRLSARLYRRRPI